MVQPSDYRVINKHRATFQTGGTDSGLMVLLSVRALNFCAMAL